MHRTSAHFSTSAFSAACCSDTWAQGAQNHFAPDTCRMIPRLLCHFQGMHCFLTSSSRLRAICADAFASNYKMPLKSGHRHHFSCGDFSHARFASPPFSPSPRFLQMQTCISARVVFCVHPPAVTISVCRLTTWWYAAPAVPGLPLHHHHSTRFTHFISSTGDAVASVISPLHHTFYSVISSAFHRVRTILVKSGYSDTIFIRFLRTAHLILRHFIHTSYTPFPSLPYPFHFCSRSCVLSRCLPRCIFTHFPFCLGLRSSRLANRHRCFWAYILIQSIPFRPALQIL